VIYIDLHLIVFFGIEERKYFEYIDDKKEKRLRVTWLLSLKTA
jgi:hypothetical protein